MLNKVECKDLIQIIHCFAKCEYVEIPCSNTEAETFLQA